MKKKASGAENRKLKKVCTEQNLIQSDTLSNGLRNGGALESSDAAGVRNSVTETMMNDVVHGMVTLPQYVKEIIDTPEFQRLRYISQIGLTRYVYPSATCTRFEHSLGTFHLTRKVVKRLKNQLEDDDELIITPEEVKCVELAALCHDLGHGPHSHFWEHAFDTSLKIKTRKHEDISVEIFQELVNQKKSTSTQNVKTILGLTEEMIDLVCRIITGKYDKEKDGHKRFLFQIVANKESGLDVDKLDYLCRDAFYLGWSNNKIHDFKRLIYFFRVVKDEGTNDWHLAMRDRELFKVSEVFSFRHILHRYGCRHRVVKSVECMFRNGIKQIIENPEARDEFIESVLEHKIPYNSDIWFSKQFISKVNDYHLWHVLKKYAREMYRNIQERNLYKLLHISQIKIISSHNFDDLENDIYDLQIFIQKTSGHSDIYLSLSIYSLQTEHNGDPLMLIKFYSKDNPKKFFNYDKDSLPNSISLKEDEITLMVFVERKIGNELEGVLKVFKSLECKSFCAENDSIIRNLRTKYKFKEIKY